MHSNSKILIAIKNNVLMMKMVIIIVSPISHFDLLKYKDQLRTRLFTEMQVHVSDVSLAYPLLKPQTRCIQLLHQIMDKQ